MHFRLSLPVALLLALGGCAPSNPGIEIEGLLGSGETDCTFAASATPTFLLTPTLDTSADFVAIRPGGIRYVAPLQLVNRMLNLGSSDYPIMADPNTFFVDEAEVELRGIDGAPLDLGGLPARFRVPASGLIPSALGETEYGRGVSLVEVVPSVYGDALVGRVGTILAAVQITGTTSGDSTQTTGELEIPITLCDGCLFACGLAEDGTPVDQLSCLPGQDQISLVAAACP